MAAYGLYTHIASNKFRSMLLLAGLFLLVYVIVYAGALIIEVVNNGDATVDYYLRVALSDVIRTLPYSTGAAALWIVIAYFFHQSIIDAVTACEHSAALFKLRSITSSQPSSVSFASDIRADPVIAATRLLMLTSVGQRGDGERCRELGIQGYLTKPTSRADLVDALGNKNVDVRRAELAWGASVSAEWAHFVALGVFAYNHGGSTAVGIAGLMRLLPAAVIVLPSTMTTPRASPEIRRLRRGKWRACGVWPSGISETIVPSARMRS